MARRRAIILHKNVYTHHNNQVGLDTCWHSLGSVPGKTSRRLLLYARVLHIFWLGRVRARLCTYYMRRATTRNPPLWNAIFGTIVKCVGNEGVRRPDYTGSLSHRGCSHRHRWRARVPSRSSYRFQISLFQLNRMEMINGHARTCTLSGRNE